MSGISAFFSTSPTLTASLLLVAISVFMTFAWYAHLKNLSDGFGKSLVVNRGTD